MELAWVEVYVTVAIFNKEEMQYKMRDIRLGGRKFYFNKYFICNCCHVSVM